MTGPRDTIDNAEAERILREAAASYIAGCRARLKPFVDRHYGLRGAARLHRAALGGDLVRAPVNLGLAVPHVLLKLTEGWARAFAARRAAAWLARRELMLKTDVEREIEWLVYTELLRLPFSQKGRRSERDALAESIFAHAEVAGPLRAALGGEGGDAHDPEFARRLEAKLKSYTGSRTAAADMTAALTSAFAGALTFSKLTPSALSLGPAVAGLVAHRMAVESFPLGSWLGEAWYSMFPAEPSDELTWGLTGGLLAFVSIVAAFAGIIADPVQRWAGIHRRRLASFIDSLEADLTGGGGRGFTVRSHYVARLLDLFEGLRAAARAAL